MINDLLSEIRIDFWRDIGLIINDEKLRQKEVVE